MYATFTRAYRRIHYGMRSNNGSRRYELGSIHRLCVLNSISPSTWPLLIVMLSLQEIDGFHVKYTPSP